MPLDADDIAVFNDPDMPGYAEAVLPGGAVVGGRFRTHPVDSFGIVESSQPSFSASSAALAAVASGNAITINGTGYVVADVNREHTPGMTRLLLK